MLLQSHDGAVHILPALPDNWKEGSVHGIMARGGFEISMEWKEGKVAEVTVHSRLGGNLRLRTYTRLLGENMVKAEGENPNNFFKPFKTASPIISDKATLKGVSLTEVFEYDIPTRAGKTYKFVAAK